MRKVWDFIQFNNAVPIGLFLLFGGAGVSLAASPEVQQAVYSSADTVQQVDNTYIVSADLANRDFALHITNVTEDADNYYVSYSYNTIDVVDYVWQEVAVNKSFQVSKKEILGQDLGLYVAKQLGQEISQQLSYLGEVQAKERAKGATAKVVATTYSGLIGKMLSPTEKTFPGYVPVVAEAPVDSSADQSAAVGLAGSGKTFVALPPSPSQDDIQALVNAAVQAALAQQAASSTAATPLSNPSAPVITVNGDNPARVAVGSTYADLGATVADDKDNNLGIHTFVNGTETDQVVLDTSTTTLYTITYRATDTDGNMGEATRSVVVYDPNASASPPPADTGTGATTTPPVDTGGGSASSTPPADTSASSTSPDTSSSGEASAPTASSTPPADTSASSTGAQ